MIKVTLGRFYHRINNTETVPLIYDVEYGGDIF